MQKLYELKEKLMRELEDYSENGKFSKDDVEAIKYIASAIDHICNIVDGKEGYSGRPYIGRSYDDMGGRSYARKRDSMGRYSRDYSGNDEMIAQLRDLMADAPDEKTKQEFRRFISKMESM